VLVGGVNGCVYLIDKHIKQKGKPKTPLDMLHPQRPHTAFKPKLSSDSCRVIFRIEKEYEGRQSFRNCS
jgi:hypothetical protein